jgi:hypothetical protein
LEYRQNGASRLCFPSFNMFGYFILQYNLAN